MAPGASHVRTWATPGLDSAVKDEAEHNEGLKRERGIGDGCHLGTERRVPAASRPTQSAARIRARQRRGRATLVRTTPTSVLRPGRGSTRDKPALADVIAAIQPVVRAAIDRARNPS